MKLPPSRIRETHVTALLIPCTLQGYVRVRHE